MRTQDLKLVDLISRDEAHSVVHLIISDHLEWDPEGGHLLFLQSKINSYLAFIESGELTTQYPQYIGLRPIIRVVLKYEPDERAEEFFREAQATCRAAGIDLDFNTLDAYKKSKLT